MSKLYLDFLEVGSSDFNTIMESCKESEVGMVIEPIKTYLDNLPDKQNVIKVNAALLFGESEPVPVYYIKPDVIKKHGLFEWMKGCNTVGRPHDFHLNYFDTINEFDQWHAAWKGPNTPKGRNLMKEGLVTSEEVPSISFYNLVKEFNIGGIKYIKLDTEGMDADLLESILDDLWDLDSVRLPEKIMFETNCHNDTTKSFQVIERLRKIGYDIMVGEVNENYWTKFEGTIYRDCKATLIPNWNEYKEN